MLQLLLILKSSCALGMLHQLLIEIVIVHIVQIVLERCLLGNLSQNLSKILLLFTVSFQKSFKFLF
jgi:hypothetical protein